MCIGLSLRLGVRLGLGCQVLGLRLSLCMSVCMHMRLSLQVLSLCLSLQALSVSGEALGLCRDLEVPRLGGPLEALGMQVLCMGLQPQGKQLGANICSWAYTQPNKRKGTFSGMHAQAKQLGKYAGMMPDGQTPICKRYIWHNRRYLEGLRLSFQGFRGIGQGMCFLGSLRVHVAAAALPCCLCRLCQLGGRHALHAVALQAVGDDQSARLHCLRCKNPLV